MLDSFFLLCEKKIEWGYNYAVVRTENMQVYFIILLQHIMILISDAKNWIMKFHCIMLGYKFYSKGWYKMLFDLISC